MFPARTAAGSSRSYTLVRWIRPRPRFAPPSSRRAAVTDRAMLWTCVAVGAVAFFVVPLLIPGIGGWLALIPVAFAALAWAAYRRRST